MSVSMFFLNEIYWTVFFSTMPRPPSTFCAAIVHFAIGSHDSQLSPSQPINKPTTTPTLHHGKVPSPSRRPRRSFFCFCHGRQRW